MAGRSERPGTDPDDWFADAEPTFTGVETRPRTESDDRPPAREEDAGDDWIAGADSPAAGRAGRGLVQTLSEWRLVIGIVALAALLLAGLAVGGVFNSGHHNAATTQATTARHATTPTRTTTATTTTPAAGTSGPTTTLKSGDSGSEVTKLQQALNQLGYSVGTVDGVYGPSTQAAVAKFQTASHLTSDGVFGPATLAALTSALQSP